MANETKKLLLDLKLGKLVHQDLGQMQIYVNYFDRHVRMKGETPTIGVILCNTKNDALVELTLPKNTNVYPKQYQLYLPSKDVLKRKLLEWTGEAKERKNRGSYVGSITTIIELGKRH